MIRTSILILTLSTVGLSAIADDAAKTKDNAAAATRTGYRLAPKAFRAAAKKVRPSLVMIETFGGIAPVAKKKGRRRRPKVTKTGDGPTTGLIISADGYILTSTFNFITRPPIITVIRQDGSRHVAKLLGRDNIRKICLLKVEDAKGWPFAKYVSDSQLKVGQWAVSVGLGYGKNPVISAGIISAKNRIGGRAVQTDANISPENYGGPLLDIEGNVIGLCVPMNPRSQAIAAGVEWYNSGIGFAIPLADAGGLLQAMKSGKTIRPAALGIQAKAVAGKPLGVEVQSFLSGSAAQKSGMQKGDRILSIGGHDVSSLTQLRFRLARFMAGQSTTVVVYRSGKRMPLKVTLGVAAATVRVTPKRKPPVKRTKNPRKK